MNTCITICSWFCSHTRRRKNDPTRSLTAPNIFSSLDSFLCRRLPPAGCNFFYLYLTNFPKPQTQLSTERCRRFRGRSIDENWAEIKSKCGYLLRTKLSWFRKQSLLISLYKWWSRIFNFECYMIVHFLLAWTLLASRHKVHHSLQCTFYNVISTFKFQ